MSSRNRLLCHDLIPSCQVCAHLFHGTALTCPACLKELKASLCLKYYRTSLYGDRIFYAFRYVDFVRRAMLAFKYSRCFQLSRVLGEGLWKVMHQHMEFQGSIILPVPTTWNKIFTRKFNPPELIAIEFASHAGLKTMPQILKKKWSWTEQKQSGSSQAKRHSNPTLLYEAKQLPYDMPPPSQWIVVDDVCTTGATLHACKKALEQKYPQIPVILAASAHG